MSVATPVLRLDDVVAGYGETTVVRGVSLSVPAGGTLAILGPNGAGKTTLLRTISGLLRPRSGSISLEGQDISDRSPSERVRRGLCHIPDPRGIFPSLTVAENLLLQAPRGTARRDAEQAVDAFPRLGQRMGQRAGTLSGGEQQMLAVARAYVQHPNVVLLDEVCMGLAPNLVDEIFEFLDARRLRGRARGRGAVRAPRPAMVDEVVVVARGRRRRGRATR